MSKRISFNKVFIQIPAFCFFYLQLVPAWAVQSHGGAEGLVSHQIGHTLFFSGMIYLLVRIYQASLNGPGWFEFKSFLWLIILWNLLTFIGHWLHEIVETKNFVLEDGHTAGFTINTFADFIFYFSRLAFIMLFRGLQIWRRAS